METQDKLKLLQRASGLTQEKLAALLGVSFPTLNSWLNGKSRPRKKAAARIDLIYLRFTGQNVIPANVLQSKKESIIFEQKKYRRVLYEIMRRNDLYKQIILSLTYNSNKIEGSTLTEDDTAAILFENRALPNKTLVEHMEAKNHQAALGFLFDYLHHDGAINEAFVLRLHAILMNGIQPDAGSYRKHGVRIVGSNGVTANHLKVAALMCELAKEYEKKSVDVLALAARVHSRFEQIHPFSDGNGRVGRLLMNAMLLKHNLPPALIFQDARKFYMLYLNQSQTEDDFSRLEDFFCDAVLDAYTLLKADGGDGLDTLTAKEPEEVYGKVLRKLAKAHRASKFRGQSPVGTGQ